MSLLLDPLTQPDCWSSGTTTVYDYDSNALFTSSLDDWYQHLWSASPHDKGKMHTMPPLRPFDFPPSPSETCSSFSTDLSPSPEPVTIRVVCDVPLVAPRPLPYHSPTFLQFDLPDPDEDLSHPPYTNRPSKRKRDNDDSDHLRLKRHAGVQPDHLRSKRHAGVQRWAAGVHRQAIQGRSHVYSATRRDRLP